MGRVRAAFQTLDHKEHAAKRKRIAASVCYSPSEGNHVLQLIIGL